MEFLSKSKRFSFKLGGKYIWDTPYTCEAHEGNGILTTVYNFEGGLRVTNTARKYEKYGAYEWVNIIENTSDTPTEIVSELWDCDCTLPMEHEEPRRAVAYVPDPKLATKIYSPAGSTGTQAEFSCDINLLQNHLPVNHINVGETKKYSCFGGRSSDVTAPFFNIHKNGKGYIFAIGWTGQWNCHIFREAESVTVRTKIEDTFFRIMPGEKFRTSSVVLLPYEGDVIDSQNKWRRLVKEHFSLIGTKGRDVYGPLCVSIWGGTTTECVLEKIEFIKEHKLPYEYLWMDAGWYGIKTQPTPDEYEGDWWHHTGDWRPSPNIHPNGLCDVSKALRDAGMKYLLWLEPERVVYSTPIAAEHPEYFLSCSNPDEINRLLDLGNEEAWNYCFKTVSDIIEKLGVNCYRQDFNFCPLEYWRRKDAGDRQGITEIKHINGMYRLWDALLEKFPSLIIDNCASGGRRIDIETLRRSIPLWRSDAQCPANYDIETTQCHSISFGTWLPYSGTGSGRNFDEYRVRSAYGASMTTNYFYTEKEKHAFTDEGVAFIKKYTEEYLRVRPFFSEDIYPLTEISDKTDTWCAAQYDRPSQSDGMMQVFRRENSPYETALFKLRGICPDSDYLFTDADGGEFTVSGKVIAEEGLRITVTEQRKAKIYFYKKVL